jgi:hypothetical protein
MKVNNYNYCKLGENGNTRKLIKYTLNLLKKIDKFGCKPVSTPIENKNKLNSEDEKPLEDINQFQRLIEKIIYLTVTRLYISFSIGQISKFMHTPRTVHIDDIDKMLRFLKGTLGKRI